MLKHTDQLFHEWRMGRPVLVASDHACFELMAVEHVDGADFAQYMRDPSWMISLTNARCRALNLPAHYDGFGLFALPETHQSLQLAADPTSYMRALMSGPLKAIRDVPSTKNLGRLMTFMLHEDMLPSLLVRLCEWDESCNQAFDLDSVMELTSSRKLMVKGGANLPIHDAHGSKIRVLEEAPGGKRHVLLEIHGQEKTQSSSAKPPMVRVHSECLTGDVFGSLKCDCGPQLTTAIERIREHGHGFIFYMRHEGRGIGITNKIRAYAMQDFGHDTYEANHMVGADEDLRDYVAVSRFIQDDLGLQEIILLTSNPEKAMGLSIDGLVITPMAHEGAENPFNRHYLEAKRARASYQDD